MKKNILIPMIIIGVIVLVAGAAVGGFFGGKAYERNHANTIRNDFMRERGIQGFDPNVAPNAVQGGANFPTGGMGRGATGEVKSIEGNTLTLTSNGTDTVITLSDTTQIVKTTSGTTADLSAGQQVMVTGQRDANGNITTATQVTILNASSTGNTP